MTAISLTSLPDAPSATEEAFNQSLVRAYVNSTWVTAASGAFMLFASMVCTVLIPSQVAVFKPAAIQILWMLGVCGGLAGTVRVLTMPSELRMLANAPELAAQGLWSLCVTFVGALPYLMAAGWLALAWVSALVW